MYIYVHNYAFKKDKQCHGNSCTWVLDERLHSAVTNETKNAQQQ